ncbi:MAG: CotH kinase family protein [Phaeodactylibacter sp.]|nr:CotH kinase family protein [Phaeodactylibacter sp.]
MKIKDNKKISRFPDRARDFFRKRRSLATWALRSGAAVVAVVLLFSVFRYGIYLKEVGHTTYFNNALQKMVKMDFSFAGNYVKGSLAELDEVAIDIKFRHMLRLQYLREQSLKVGFILPEYKAEEFPAKLTHKGKTINVKIALTGLVAKSHLRNPAKWSFEVKVKGDDTFMGMKSFAMLLPSTRGYLTDWLGFELMKAKGLMGMRVDFVNVSFNGKSSGIYYLEERFEKYLVENNSMREGIIFKIENGLEPYKEGKLMESASTRDQLLMLKRMYQEVMAGTLPPGKLFDLRKMAQVFVVCDLMDNKHPLAGQNLRYYFNPVTGLAEPIAREWEELHAEEEDPIALFLEKPRPATRHFRFERRPFIRMIYDNLEFKKYYIQEAAEASQVQFLDQLLQRNEAKIDALMKKVYRTWPFYEHPAQYLYRNQKYMRSVLFPESEQLTAYFREKDGGRLRVYLQNQQYMPLQVDYLSLGDSIRFYPEAPVALDSKAKLPKGEVLSFDFTIPEGLRWDDAWAEQLTARYNLLGLEPGAKSTPVRAWAGEASFAQSRYSEGNESNYASFGFIAEDPGSNILTIPAGEWAISRDVYIPSGKRLVVAPGARISLSDQARIISRSPVSFAGTEQQPILVHSPDGTGRGLLLLGADGHSNLEHVTFDQISGYREESGLSFGALTFYKSPVSADNCVFSNTHGEEAALRAIQGELYIGQALFRNITGNAIDADFCTGSVHESSFTGIGGHGVSLRGSEFVLSHLFLSGIGGEGVAAREESEVETYWLQYYTPKEQQGQNGDTPEM